MPQNKGRDLKKAATHISYEIEMMIFAGHHLGGWHSSPMSRPTGNAKNMALECFLLHYRNLRAFLCPSLQKVHRDDIFACFFLGADDLRDVVDAKHLAEDKARVDKMLAHISSARDQFIDEGQHAWDISRMSLLMLSHLETFLDRLSPEVRSWFPPSEHITRRKEEALSPLEASTISVSDTVVTTT